MKGVAIRSRLERGSAVRWIAWQCLTDEPRDTSFRYPLLQRDYPWNVCTCCLSSYSPRFQSELTLCCTIYNKSWCSSGWGISAALLILIWSTRFHYTSRPMNQWIRKTRACIISGRPARLPSAELVQTWQNPRRSPGFWQTSSVSASVKLVISFEAKVWKAWRTSSINSALTCGVGTLSTHQWRSYARRIAVMKFSRMWMKMNAQILTTSQQQQTISANVTSMLDLSNCLTIWWAISYSYHSIFKKLGNDQLVHPPPIAASSKILFGSFDLKLLATTKGWRGTSTLWRNLQRVLIHTQHRHIYNFSQICDTSAMTILHIINTFYNITWLQLFQLYSVVQCWI